MAKQLSSFLGANTPSGFVSLFDELYNPYTSSRALIIKGGPGTGKSTLMKKFADECTKKGYSTEKVYCSSDPDSLDAVIVPEIDLCIADGTSPHLIEPKFPGACENIINTGEFWDEKLLCEKGAAIRSLTLENSLRHRTSSKYLAAAGSLNDENIHLMSKYIDMEKVRNFAYRFTARELPKKKGCVPGKRYRRFLSAITPEGLVFKEDTVKALCFRVIGISDEYGNSGALLLNMISDNAVRNGYDVILCQCPMRPHGECEHIIIPEKGIALISIKSMHGFDLEFDRIIHSKRFLYDGYKKHLPFLRLNRRLIKELIAESISQLRSAKEIHDELEKIYLQAMDFSALGEYVDKIIDNALN